MPDTEPTELTRKIQRERGFDCGVFKENFLQRRLGLRLRAVGQPTLRAYRRFLARDPAEYARLFDALSINVTHFFRDASTFRAIRDRVLPQLLADKLSTGSRTLRAWSAGCATGEETYSLAVLVAEATAHSPLRFTARIYGTDIDAAAVARARGGVYESSAMGDVARAHALRHFMCNGHYQVSPAVRQLVRFRVHDLVNDPPLRHLDLILCRNVLVYFSAPARRRVLDTLISALRPGGFLVLGKTELIGAEARAPLLPFDMRERIYRKQHYTIYFKGGH